MTSAKALGCSLVSLQGQVRKWLRPEQSEMQESRKQEGQRVSPTGPAKLWMLL